MAFQQPQRQHARQASFNAPSTPIQIPPRQASPPPERQEWVLFSPRSRSDTLDQTDSTVRTDRITGQLSDFGSLETAAVSQGYDEQDDDNATEDPDLDDALHAFNEPSIPFAPRGFPDQSADSIMPSHDGLGMFPGNSSPVQEQFWQHERYNPKRRRSLRRASLQRRAHSFEEEQSAESKEDEKAQRIEQWRNDQSKAILEEIERETRRRRRRSRLSLSNSQTNIPISKSAPETQIAIIEPTRTERLSFWERLTRRVIRDLIGIDDATLEYIFGESYCDEPEPKPAPSAASAIVDYAETSMPDDDQATPTSSWDQKLLGRIAKELGILFNHISEHPGAFSTYLQTQDQPSYAGLHSAEPVVRKSRSPQARRTTRVDSAVDSDKMFAPTIGHHHHRRHSTMTIDPTLWGIEEEGVEEEPVRTPSASAEAERLKLEKDYWERDLDVKMVFGFLRNRLTSSPTPTAQASTSSNAQQPSSMFAQPSASTSAPQNQADTLRRAALIRHHHPLISRSSTTPSLPAQRTRINSGTSAILTSGMPVSPILGRRSSRGAADTESCASQSTKRSRTGRSGSSRNYWDLGGSDGLSGGWGQV